MKFYRYMSNQEFSDLCAGIDLHNYSKHYRHARTGSNGFCFLGEETIVHGRPWSAAMCYAFLAGVVSEDVLVEFDAPENLLTKSYGVYADPYTCDWYDTITVTEYCIPEYSRYTMLPMRYCIPSYYACEVQWYDCNLISDHERILMG